MKSDFEIYIDRRLSKHDMTPSALALSFYYVGGTGTFKQLRATAEQYRAIFYSNLNSLKQ